MGMTRKPPFFRATLVALGLTALAATSLAALTASAPDDEKTGGDTTVFATGRNAFSFPLANLPDAERTRLAALRPADYVGLAAVLAEQA